MTIHQFPLRSIGEPFRTASSAQGQSGAVMRLFSMDGSPMDHPCDTEPMCQNAHDWTYVQTTPRIYSPTMQSATLFVRVVYWAQLFATALLAIAACLAVGAACGALAVWMNTP